MTSKQTLSHTHTATFSVQVLDRAVPPDEPLFQIFAFYTGGEIVIGHTPQLDFFSFGAAGIKMMAALSMIFCVSMYIR